MKKTKKKTKTKMLRRHGPVIAHQQTMQFLRHDETLPRVAAEVLHRTEISHATK